MTTDKLLRYKMMFQIVNFYGTGLQYEYKLGKMKCLTISI